MYRLAFFCPIKSHWLLSSHVTCSPTADWLMCVAHSILGMNLFGGTFCESPDGLSCSCKDRRNVSVGCVCDRANFDNLIWSLVTVFQVLVLTPPSGRHLCSAAVTFFFFVACIHLPLLIHYYLLVFVHVFIWILVEALNFVSSLRFQNHEFDFGLIFLIQSIFIRADLKLFCSS